MKQRGELLVALLPCLVACHDWDSLSTRFRPSGASSDGAGAGGAGGNGAGGNGAGGSGGSMAPYCASLASSPVLCNDFDGVGPLVDWETVDDPPGGTVAVDDAFALSAPRSLRIGIPASGEFLPAFLQQSVPVPADGAVLGFDLRVHVAGDDPLLAAALQNYGPDCAVGVEIIGDGARAVQWGAAGSTESAFVPLAPSGAWSRVELRFDRSSDPATVRLDVDGETGATLDADPCTDQPYLQVGALYAAPGGGWDLSIDNLLIRAP
jgi:hypothetical protein